MEIFFHYILNLNPNPIQYILIVIFHFYEKNISLKK